VKKKESLEAFRKAAADRILLFDGGIGTAIQDLKLDESDYRGDRFSEHPDDLKGNADILNLVRPEAVRAVHESYFEVGADIIETNTFNATRISQADYGVAELVYEINLEGASIARQVADHYSALTPDKPRFVAGSMGPTNKTLSISPDVERPEYRAVTFDEVEAAYKEAAAGLIDGGADFLLIETIFDTLNAKAAIAGVQKLEAEKGAEIPVVLSLTVTDLSGRTLSGQTVEAFWHSVRHAKPLAVGVNCAFGAQDLRPFVKELSRLADCLLIAFPNAGLPDELGLYTEPPDVTAGELGEWARSRLLNIVGGCCGTTPAHISAIGEKIAGVAPRIPAASQQTLRLSGLEAVSIGQ
jgi:5-methyltetrahydrofolate--homocysteine methyltransferase